MEDRVKDIERKMELKERERGKEEEYFNKG